LIRDWNAPVQVTSDGAGGGIVITRNNDSALCGHRISSSGQKLWTDSGVVIGTTYAFEPQAVSDGSGGVIVAWRDHRTGVGSLYAQRIDAIGSIAWESLGMRVCPGSARTQESPTLVPDGEGGAIVAWKDYRNWPGGLPANTDIYAQRINGQGVLRWTDKGAPICNNLDGQSYPAAATDGANGAIIAWTDGRNWPEEPLALQSYNDIFASRVSPYGLLLPQWLAAKDWALFE
jgi:hypothetical protein